MKTFVIAILIVVLLGGGLASVAYGAGMGNPLNAINQGMASLRSSLPVLQPVVSNPALPAAIEPAVNSSPAPVLAEAVTPADEELPKDDWVGPEERYIPWGDGYCDGTAAEPHPILTRLAEQFGVTYDELLGWYCQGWRAGQIAIAYAISQETGVPVADLFAKRESGMSWREILAELGYDFDDFTPPAWIDPTPYCDGTATEPHPGVSWLSEFLGVPYEEILGWLCDGWSLQEIALAYKVSEQTGVPVADLFAMRESGKSWQEILVELGLLPEDFIGKPVMLPDKNICMDDAVHPLAARLAEKLGVSLDEIKDLFCNGYGFGEIEQAYAIAAQVGVPVSEIIAMRQSGMSWGEIRQQFDLSGGLPRLDKPGQPERPDKPEFPVLPPRPERPILPPGRGR
jgi:uncharacterized protein (DUF433 family)